MSPRPKCTLTILWTILLFLFGTYLYCHDESTLSGPWMLDDKGTITMNPVIVKEKSWREVWLRDFWGHNKPQDKKSHKSWRPLTTASYKLNYIWIHRYKNSVVGDDELNPYWFHVVDRILHGIVSALSYHVAIQSLQCVSSLSPECSIPIQKTQIFVNSVSLQAFMTALLFTTHPIHVEAVSNTTGRAEVLCALFYFIGFCIYCQVKQQIPSLYYSTTFYNLLKIIWMLLCAFLATLCKEHGITLPLMCVIWDFFSIASYLQMNDSKNEEEEKESNLSDYEERKRREIVYNLCFRIYICMVGMVGIAIWRLKKNGSTKPDFVCEQNPAACHGHFLTRSLYLNYLGVYNLWLLICPDALSPDRSGDSIPMLTHPATDPRVPAVFLMWILLAIVFSITVTVAISTFTALIPPGKYSTIKRQLQAYFTFTSFSCSLITACLWMLIPFLMSSNLLVYVGFVVADRTLYLPSFGFCLMMVQILPRLISTILSGLWRDCNKTSTSLPNETKHPNTGGARNRRWCIHEVLCASIFVIMLSLYTKKLIRQNKRWSDPVLLWGEAYRLYPSSCINGKEYGMSLVNAQRPRDAIPVLLDMSKRELANTWFTQTVEGFRKELLSDSEKNETKSVDLIRKIGRYASILQTRFKLVTAMGNVGRCDEANKITDDGLHLIETSLREIHEMKKSPVLGEERIREMFDEKENFSDSIKSIEEAIISNKAYMLVSKSRCANTLLDMAKYAYAAVKMNANMDYSLEHAKTVSEVVEQIQSAHVDVAKVDIIRTLNQDGQSVQISFAVRS